MSRLLVYFPLPFRGKLTASGLQAGAKEPGGCGYGRGSEDAEGSCCPPCSRRRPSWLCPGSSLHLPARLCIPVSVDISFVQGSGISVYFPGGCSSAGSAGFMLASAFLLLFLSCPVAAALRLFRVILIVRSLILWH